MWGFTAQKFHFADFTLDQSRYQLRRAERVLRLEKRPMELLILLVQRQGELVSREEIAGCLWGKDVFLDVDHSINTAVRKVRMVLRDDPDKPRFVETVVGKGYRFAAPVICSNGDSNKQTHSVESATLAASAPAVSASVVPAPAIPAAEERVASIRLRVLLVGVAALVLFIVGWWLNRSNGRGITQPAIKSLAVLPLKNLSGDPSQEYFADGMTEAVIGRLSMIRGLRVISRTSVMNFKDTRMSVPEIAKALHVDALVEGSVIRQGGRVRITAQLIRGATDAHFWSETYDRDLGDALALESEVAQSIARRVEVTVNGDERTRLIAARPVSPDVYESFLKGQSVKGSNQADIEKSIAYFEEAIRKDPAFAPAYIGLAEAYDNLGSVFVGGRPGDVRPKEISAVRKALELDPELAEAHILLANIEQKHWQWAAAEAEYRRTLELNPNSAVAHLGLANWMLCQGRTEEALSWARRARELDPLGDSGIEIGWILFQSHRYEVALHEYRSALAVRPDDITARWFLGFALIANGQPESAIPELEKVVSDSDRSPATIALLIRAYAHAGRRADALRLLEEMKRRKQTSYVPAAAFVNAYLGLDDKEMAFASLEQAYQEQSNILQYLKVHPFFDPLRDDPRFADLVRRVGLN